MNKSMANLIFTTGFSSEACKILKSDPKSYSKRAVFRLLFVNRIAASKYNCRSIVNRVLSEFSLCFGEAIARYLRQEGFDTGPTNICRQPTAPGRSWRTAFGSTWLELVIQDIIQINL